MKGGCSDSRLWLSVFLAIAAIAVQGCATLSEEECQHADWHTVGYEDGVLGHPATRIRAHREACAEYAVTPVLDEYMRGRAQGLEQYCRPRNGYAIGISGKSYSGVCPQPLQSEFLAAYRYGKEIHALKGKVHSQKRDIDRLHQDLEEISVLIQDKESELISKGIETNRRVQLLVEIKQLLEEKESIESALAHRENVLVDLQDELHYLREHSSY